MKDAFKSLKERIEKGKLEESVPMGFNRLTYHVGLYRESYYLVGGDSGTGKSTFICDAFILNPYDWYRKNKDTCRVKLKIFYFSMERKIDFLRAKWISRKIFMDHGIIISPNTITGRVPKEYKITPEQEQYVDMYEDYINDLEEGGILDVITGPQNPMGIKKYIDNYARSHGKHVKIDDYHKIYVPDNPEELVIIIYDHIGLIIPEKRDGVYYGEGKPVIDLASRDAQRFRDYYGYSPVVVSQFNRSINDTTRVKMGSIQPNKQDFKDTSSTWEACDTCLALFDPIRNKIAFPEGTDTLGYSLDKLRDGEGKKKYKSLHILKGTYGADDIQIGLAFQPVVGLFKEMPLSKSITDSHYEMIRDDSYFLM